MAPPVLAALGSVVGLPCPSQRPAFRDGHAAMGVIVDFAHRDQARGQVDDERPGIRGHADGDGIGAQKRDAAAIGMHQRFAGGEDDRHQALAAPALRHTRPACRYDCSWRWRRRRCRSRRARSPAACAACMATTGPRPFSPSTDRNASPRQLCSPLVTGSATPLAMRWTSRSSRKKPCEGTPRSSASSSRSTCSCAWAGGTPAPSSAARPTCILRQ